MFPLGDGDKCRPVDLTFCNIYERIWETARKVSSEKDYITNDETV
jgi:hypothetical protein